MSGRADLSDYVGATIAAVITDLQQVRDTLADSKSEDPDRAAAQLVTLASELSALADELISSPGPACTQ